MSLIALAVCLTVLTSAGATAPPVEGAAAPRIDIARARDCTQIPPEQLPPLERQGRRLPVEVRVMADPDDLGEAQRHIRTTRRAFRGIDIKLRASFDAVEVPDSLGESSSDAYFDFMKDHYDGRRPRGVDLVYLFAPNWSGGLADCIGGVRFADRAFAFGSLDYRVEGTVPAPTVNEGVIAAHELGHLLGAHHHYSNCVEALPAGAPAGDIQPCTTMSPLALTASATFSLVEASYVRLYAAAYARG